LTALRSWKKFVVVAALACAMFGATLGRSDAFLDKTRFATHLGIAFFSFHHWVMKPYQQGAFATGAPHRISTMVKGGAALLFAVHEVKVAQKIAHTSNDPLLHKLEGNLGGLTATLATVGAGLKAGHFNPADLTGLSKQTDSVGEESAADGVPVKDVPAAIPGV